jgi:hypothetical protein
MSISGSSGAPSQPNGQIPTTPDVHPPSQPNALPAGQASLHDVTAHSSAAAHYADALKETPHPLSSYEVSPSTGPKIDVLSPSPQPPPPNTRETAAPEIGKAGAPDGAFSRETTEKLAKQFVEHFNSEANRDEVYPPAIVAVRREYEGVRAERAARGEATERLSFEPVSLTPEDWTDLEDRLEAALEGPSPGAPDAKAREAVLAFLKDTTADRVGEDQATYLCRWLMSRTEISPSERYELASRVLDDINETKNKTVSIAFMERVETETAAVFVERAADYGKKFLDDLGNSFKPRFLPSDIRTLHAAYDHWRCPLPGFPATFAFGMELLARAANVINRHKPLTEFPGEELTQTFEDMLCAHAATAVEQSPFLYGLRQIAQRNDLTPGEKVTLAVRMDADVAQASSRSFQSDQANSPQFDPVLADLQRAVIRARVEGGARDLIAARMT